MHIQLKEKPLLLFSNHFASLVDIWHPSLLFSWLIFFFFVVFIGVLLQQEIPFLKCYVMSHYPCLLQAEGDSNY